MADCSKWERPPYLGLNVGWTIREDITKGVKERDQGLKILQLNFKNVHVRGEMCQSSPSVCLRSGNDQCEAPITTSARSEVEPGEQCEPVIRADFNLCIPFFLFSDKTTFTQSTRPAANSLLWSKTCWQKNDGTCEQQGRAWVLVAPLSSFFSSFCPQEWSPYRFSEIPFL